MFRRFDLLLLLPAFVLLAFGLLVIASVSPENLTNQLLFTLLGILALLAFSRLDTEILFAFSPFVYGFSLLFLTLPIFLGTVTRGSVRWIPLGSFSLQPSEIVKPFIALCAAWYWASRDFSYKNLAIFILLALPPLGLVFAQPDLGSSLVLGSIIGGLIILAKISVRQLLTLLAVCALVLPLGWFSLHDYQQERFTHFLNPSGDPLGAGYNQIQATITVGSGNFSGRGWGNGTQSHLSFLPERHTDFIFSSLAEEFGFIGSMIVLVCYILLLGRILKIASTASSRGQGLIVYAVFFYLFFQTVVNIGMNLGLLPITGITLPLVSYGGSSLLTTFLSLGLVEAVYKATKPKNSLFIK